MAKQRKDSAHVQTEIIKSVIHLTQPPAHVTLRDGDFPFWNDIILARAEWTNIDLCHAANLARCLSDIERVQKQLDFEGDVSTNSKGTKVMNPLFSILEQLSRRAVTISTKIQVHAAATLGESKLGRGKNTQKREADKALKATDDDDLISRPHA